ncbi:hypothetical protein HDU85_005593 [Gaertneriomyces sp. JEL0708]|nr:hypothetical protein HDU85_005593 [Gaertneriomyces sp. JEL0708]
MDFEAGGSILNQLQNELHPDTAPQGSRLSPTYDVPEPVAEASVEPQKGALDIQNEELFPALPAAAPGKSPIGSWAAKGVNGPGHLKPAPSGSSGPIRASKVTERLEIPAELQNRKLQNQKGKPLTAAAVCKDIQGRFGTSIDISTNSKTGVMTVLINGKPSAVKQTKREVVNALTIPVKESVYIPVSVRPHLVGKGGSNIRALAARTMTKIDIPRSQDEPSSAPVDEHDDDDMEQEVIIIGDYEGVTEAKREIESLVATRTSKRTVKLTVERSYLPFIAGPNGSQVQLLQLETGTRIHIPPFVATTDRPQNEILIVGERAGVLEAEARIKAIYDEVKRTTRSLVIPVKKRQHRFIIGPKGATLQEILDKTGCSVELPPSSDPAETVTIRGPDKMLSTAVALVIEKANSIVMDEIDVIETIASTIDPELFLRFVYIKERAQLKAIESAHGATILQQKSSEGRPILELQAKRQDECDAARAELYALVKDWGTTLCFGAVEIPNGLHKYVIGKGGQNITKVKAMKEWEGRLVDVVVPHENDDSDEVIIVVKRVPGMKGGISASDKEASQLIEKVQKELESHASALADLSTQTINIDAKYHGRLIGAQGAALKELLLPYENAVSVKFPKSTEQDAIAPTAVVVRGPKNDVSDVIDKINKQIAEWRHVELMSNFSEVVRTAKGVGKRLVGASGRETRWIVNAVREKIASGEVHKSKINEKELAPANLNLRAEVESLANEDVVTIYGPKTIVALAKPVVQERAQKLADTISEELDLFTSVSSAAQRRLLETGGDIHRRVLRRLIGKEGKGIKRISEKHGIHLQFADRRRSKTSRDEDDEERDVVEADVDEKAANPGLLTIKGSRDDVPAAKKELLELVEHEIMHSYVLSSLIAKKHLPYIVGRGGSKVQAMKDEFNVRIDFNDIEGDEENIDCVIEGTKDGCHGAQEQILEIVDEKINFQASDISIPFYLHKHIIGPAGTRIRGLVEQFGGPEKVKIQFPRANSDPTSADDVISVKAHGKAVSSIKDQLVKLVTEALAEKDSLGIRVAGYEGDEDVVEEVVTVPKAEVQRIVGRGGDSLTDLLKRFDVTVWMANSTAEEQTFRLAAPSGKEQNLPRAKDEILSKIRIVETVNVQPEIAERLADADELEKDVLLTRLQDIAKRVKQETGASAELSHGAGKTPTFFVRGDKKGVDRGVKACQKFLTELDKFSHSHVLQVPSDILPHIIGRQGFMINRLREESGAEIDIVRDPRKRGLDAVDIRATTGESVQKAVQLVENILRQQEERSKRDAEREEARNQEEALRVEAARIDDEKSHPDDISTSINGSPAPVIPGWSGRAQVPRPSRNKKKRGDETPSSIASQSSTGGGYYAYAGPATLQAPDNGWKEVGKKTSKGKKKDEAQPEIEVKPEIPGAVNEPSSTSSSGKKKNKKKKKPTSSPQPSAGHEADAPVSTPVRPVAIDDAKAKIGVKENAVIDASPSQIPEKTTSRAQSASPERMRDSTTPRQIPVPRSEESKPVDKPATLPFDDWEEPKADDNEWQTVPQASTVKKFKQAKLAATTKQHTLAFGSIPVMPMDDEEAAKKKKKKKGKKKKVTGEAAVPGLEE